MLTQTGRTNARLTRRATHTRLSYHIIKQYNYHMFNIIVLVMLLLLQQSIMYTLNVQYYWTVHVSESAYSESAFPHKQAGITCLSMLLGGEFLYSTTSWK